MEKTAPKVGKSYELLIVLSGALNSAEIQKQSEKWEAEVNKVGKIEHKALWELRPLAYKIGSEEMGTYLVYHFSAQDKLLELENSLRLSPKVIRHLLYVTPKYYEWREYTPEDLEHDFTKLSTAVKEEEQKPIKKKVFKPVAQKIEVPKIIKFSEKEAPKVPAKVPEKSAKDAAELDKKLDDILDNL